MRFLYLHGFASSPASRKAQAFSRACALHSFSLEIPDLVPGDFSRITLSGQLRVIEDFLQGDPCCLIGSSMGGYLASLYAAAHPETERLVLLAPAFEFARRWCEIQGPASINQWRTSGWLEVFHYGTQSSQRVHYELFEDASRYPPQPDFHQPALILHGIHDTTVPIQYSRAFVATHANATLREFDSDHELLNVLDAITAEAMAWLGLS